jgi:hypothetical protein
MKYFRRITALTPIFLLISSHNLHSQIILTPQISGSVHHIVEKKFYFRPSGSHTFSKTEEHTHINPNQLAFGKTYHQSTGVTTYSSYRFRFTRIGEIRGIVEFFSRKSDDNGQLPADWMTTWNWSAMLKGFIVSENDPGSKVIIFEQDPLYSDGLLTVEDYHSSDYSRTLFHAEVVLGMKLDPIDITDQLRNCLFSEYPSDYIGAVLLIDVPWNIAITRLTDPHIEINYSASYTPTPGPSPTPQSTPTPKSGPDFRIKLNLNRTLFSPGDPFQLVVTIKKPDEDSYYNQPLFVLLDVYGEYYFYPSWNTYLDYKLVDVTVFIASFPILNFEWPAVTSSADGIAFHAAILNSSMTSVAGNIDSVAFGWTGE